MTGSAIHKESSTKLLISVEFRIQTSLNVYSSAIYKYIVLRCHLSQWVLTDFKYTDPAQTHPIFSKIQLQTSISTLSNAPQHLATLYFAQARTKTHPPEECTRDILGSRGHCRSKVRQGILYIESRAQPLSLPSLPP